MFDRLLFNVVFGAGTVMLTAFALCLNGVSALPGMEWLDDVLFWSCIAFLGALAVYPPKIKTS